jgi:hypothetical protein
MLLVYDLADDRLAHRLSSMGLLPDTHYSGPMRQASAMPSY